MIACVCHGPVGRLARARGVPYLLHTCKSITENCVLSGRGFAETDD
jgi:hypothetical protein